MPNPPIASPAKRFIDRRMRALNRSRKCFTMLLSTLHHAIEPQKIPPMRNTVNHHRLRSLMPSAARRARNDSTVVGFVRVKRNVHLKSEYAPARSCFARSAARAA